MKLVSLVALKLVVRLDNAADSPALPAIKTGNRRDLIAMIDPLCRSEILKYTLVFIILRTDFVYTCGIYYSLNINQFSSLSFHTVVDR